MRANSVFRRVDQIDDEDVNRARDSHMQFETPRSASSDFHFTVNPNYTSPPWQL
jgi:hypothetical protein